MHSRALLLREVLSSGESLSQDPFALRIVGDRRHGGTGVDQVRVGLGRHVLGEAADDTQRVLERVPARQLEDDRRVGSQRLILDRLRAPLYATRRASLSSCESLRSEGSML